MQVGYTGVIMCGQCMLRSADKQSRLLYAVAFIFRSFGDAENIKKNFEKNGIYLLRRLDG